MFSEAWSIPFLFALPFSVAVMHNGDDSNSDFLFILGFLLTLANIVFLGETLFLGEEWWHGLVIFALSLIVTAVYTLVRQILLMVIANSSLLLLLWLFLETMTGIALPIYCQFCLFD